MSAAFVAEHLTSDLPPLTSALRSKRHSPRLQKRARLIVIARRGHNRDVHAAQLVDLIEIEFREDQLLANSDRIITAAVESFRRNTPKIPHARQRYRHEPIKEFVHLLAAQRDHDADGHSLSQLEAG